MPTLKNGSPVTIKRTGEAFVINEIKNGRYLLSSGEYFWSHEIIAIKQKLAPKPKTKIRQVSAFQSVLNEIYKILHLEFLKNNPICMAKLEDCSRNVSEIHHMYKRTGYFLICEIYFLPICSNCHGYITERSQEALDMGLSISRLSDAPYHFSNRALELLAEFEVKLP